MELICISENNSIYLLKKLIYNSIMSIQQSLFTNRQDENMSGVMYKSYLLKRKIVLCLATHGELPTAELARQLNVSCPTITKLLLELVSEGYVCDTGKIETPGGRRPLTYGLVADAGYFLGVDLHDDKVNFGVIDLNKNMVSISKHNRLTTEDSTAALNELCTMIENYIASMDFEKSQILGMGIILRGRVDSSTGHSYNHFTFENRPLSQVMKERIGIETIIENDTRAMAYAEYTCGDTGDAKNALFINITRGVGVGIVIGGKLYYGKSGFAGEFGHIPFFDNETICYCGKKGCLETEASGAALESKFNFSLRQGASSILSDKFKRGERVTLTDIIEAAHKDDVLSIELITGIGEKLGRGIGVLINIFNPELVVVGGVMSEVGDYLMLPIRTALNKYSLSLVNRDTILRLSSLGDSAGVIGAAQLTRNSILEIV